MMVVDYIKSWLQRKIYVAVRKVSREETTRMFMSMKHIGADFYFCGACRIIGPEFISIGDNFYCGEHARMEAINGHLLPQLHIGDNFSMEDFCHIACASKVEIGNGVLLGSKVFITDHFQGDISANDLNTPPSKGILNSKRIYIGNNVLIGDNVSIMPGVTLGDNVIVGANAVVTHSFSAGSVIAGCPAKIIKNLYELDE